MALSREEILNAINTRKADTHTIPVPEWGGELKIQRLTSEDADASGLTDPDGLGPDKYGRVLSASIVDDDGNLLFTEDDIATLAQAEIGVVARVFAECIDFNGLGEEAQEKAVAAFDEAQPEASSSS